jgi:hypothetical protein
VSESLLNIYARSEGYYLVSSAKTSDGLWQHIAEPPTFLEAHVSPAHIGREALEYLAEPRPNTAHPQGGEWKEARRKSLDPIIRAAKVRSWRAFISNATTVDVERTNDSFKVTPMKAMSKPRGGFEPDLSQELGLDSPTPEDLGRAILQAFTAATRA